MVNKIIHPTATKEKSTRSYRPRSGGGGEKKYNTKREYDNQAVSQLKVKNSRFPREVTQKHEIFPRDVKKPKFYNSHEECAEYIFTGKYVGGGKWMRAKSHTPPIGAREESLTKFQKECLERYNTNKKPDAQDFQ